MRRRKGQIVIIATLALAILILSVSVMLYESASTYRQVKRMYLSGVLDNIGKEFDKVLTYILMDATHRYNSTAEIDTPRAYAHLKFSYWVKSLIRELSEYGAQVNITYPHIFLQSERELYGVKLENRYVHNLIKLYWYAPQALSVISASININIPGLGFYGWNKTSIILLNATVLLDKVRNIQIDSDTSYTILNILVNKERNVPIERLNKLSFKVMYFHPGMGWLQANIIKVVNSGGGNYTLYLTQHFSNSQALPEGLEKYLIIWVMDDRGIIVELYTYDHIDYIVQENAIQPFYPDSDKKYETYVFEVRQNGQWYWLNKPLNMNGTRPIPIPPIKQIRVYATENGINDDLHEIPSQVEEWTPDYKKPTLRFANWTGRFSRGDKLVFMLSFNGIGIDKQRVRIKWFHDADLPPPSYLIQINVQPPYIYVNNSVYTLQLLANPGYGGIWDIDWSISLHGRNYHIEYFLFRYDVPDIWDLITEGIYEFRISTGNWTLLIGPVRVIAYRENNLTYDPSTDSLIKNELKHVEIIEIPYDTQYFLYFGYFKWLTDIDVNYLGLFGQISGTAEDTDSPYRVKYGAIQLENLASYLNGSYSIYDEDCPLSSTCLHRYRFNLLGYQLPNDAGNFGYWIAQYNEFFGQALFIDDTTYNLLKSPEYEDTSEVWAWSTFDHARRVLSYDLLYWKMPKWHINNGTEFDVFFAGFLYEGGTVSEEYRDIFDWNYISFNIFWWCPIYSPGVYAYKIGTGGEIPQMYYRMFVQEYFPNITIVTY